MPIQPDDVLLNKAAIIERALRRVREELAQDTSLVNYTHIDAMTLNVAVHEYQELNMAVLKHIAENGWRSLVSYCAELRLRITS
ncbi:MAG: hypothetical protein Q8O19_01810 [Rectinemataceae bacterium]|nr:hypothetical protein [Rectinemataceae bacterium]